MLELGGYNLEWSIAKHGTFSVLKILIGANQVIFSIGAGIQSASDKLETNWELCKI